MTEELPITDDPTSETQPPDTDAAAESTPAVDTAEPPATLPENEIAEISETERSLESLTAKLAQFRETTHTKQTEIADQLTALIAQITQLQDSLPTLRSAVESAAADVASDQGASEALESFATELEGGDEEGGIAELQKLIRAEQQLILDAGKKLVGDANPAYLAEFLDETRNPGLTIDMDRAGGISFEIKNTRDPAVKRARKALDDICDKKGPLCAGDPEIQLAEKNLNDAEFDRKQAYTEAQKLGEQIQRSRATIHELQISVQKAQKLPAIMRERAQGITQDPAHTTTLDATNATLATVETNLEDARSEKAGLDSVMQLHIDLISRIDQLADQIPHTIETLNRAEEMLNQMPDLAQKLVALCPEIHQISDEVMQEIDGNLVSIGTLPMRDHVASVARGLAEAQAALDLLHRGTERLEGLRRTLEDKAKTADAAETLTNQNLVQIAETLDAAKDLERFMDNEWPEIEAGSTEGVAAICVRTRTHIIENASVLLQLATTQLTVLAQAGHPEATTRLSRLLEKAKEIITGTGILEKHATGHAKPPTELALAEKPMAVGEAASAAPETPALTTEAITTQPVKGEATPAAVPDEEAVAKPAGEEAALETPAGPAAKEVAPAALSAADDKLQPPPKKRRVVSED